jgi:hypothetical protein
MIDEKKVNLQHAQLWKTHRFLGKASDAGVRYFQNRKITGSFIKKPANYLH